jgi:glycosyltransferase involved in cell wall biosynthesis
MATDIVVSVIIPVYNADRYLKQSIDSILQQSFANFECIIINDGSTDSSEEIINSYYDERIVYVKNKINSGVVTTMNKGVALAKGQLIAVMHADDIAIDKRLELQVAWMNRNPQTTVLAGFIDCIDESNNTIKQWDVDRKTITEKQIKHTMVWECCIAHPTVMIRSEVLKKYNYSNLQNLAEDYPLWLQLLNDGYIIEKIPQVVLKYRAHKTSATGSILKKKNPFFVQAIIKQKFLLSELNKFKFTFFSFKLVITCCYDLLMGLGKEIKRKLSSVV